MSKNTDLILNYGQINSKCNDISYLVSNQVYRSKQITRLFVSILSYTFVYFFVKSSYSTQASALALITIFLKCLALKATSFLGKIISRGKKQVNFEGRRQGKVVKAQKRLNILHAFCTLILIKCYVV